MNGYFITGTDTGVGKTHVTAALARSARTLGKKVFAFKPVESGCEAINGHLFGADMEALAKAAGDWQQGDLRGVYRLRSPVAPYVASIEDKVEIELARIVRTAKDGAGQADITLVEGAGGWRVPLTANQDIADLARELGLPVVVVCRATLGTINHSLLSIEAVERDGCRVAALVLSRRPDESPEFARSNAEQIGRRWKGQVLVYEGPDSVFRGLF
ncbi:MAG TPA: dethiobiotin synthase [Kofleriaceae bacterium]|nr:dethiobiotin synthase [Kofleriaceae bacterium]